jgi:CBS domain-containing protein
MKTVKEIMITSPQYCGQNETLQALAEKMSKSNIGSLPVLDDNKKVIGVITDRDITLAAGTQVGKKLSEIKVLDVIQNRKVHTVTPEDNLQTALQIMRTKQVGRLPVVDKEQNLRGVVSLNHIVRQTHGSNEHAEIGYAGKENVFNTLHSLANRKKETVFENQEMELE